MSNHHEWFSSYKKFDTVENIKIGDGKYNQAMRSRDIDIFAFNGKEWVWKYLSNVFHVSKVSIFFRRVQLLTKDYDNTLITKNAHSWRMKILLQWKKEKISYS